MNTKIVTLEEARRQGLVHYFTGKPCKHGHTDLRRVKGRSCVACSYDRVKQHEESKVSKNPRYHQERHLRRTFNLSLKDYDTMLAAQDNACPLCSRSFDTVVPHVDHCHSTGKVRGILCGPCNQAIGLFKEDTEAMQKAIGYLS